MKASSEVSGRDASAAPQKALRFGDLEDRHDERSGQQNLEQVSPDVALGIHSLPR
jgi:hypothetical protein